MQEMQQHLDRAVRRRAPASGPVFSHLSGGLDSTSIAAFAAAAGRDVTGYAFYPRPLPGVDLHVDERPAIEAVTALYPTINLVPIKGAGMELLATGGMDPYFPIPVDPRENYEILLARARADGARTVMSGFGGDEVISNHGHAAFVEMFLGGRWRNLAETLGQHARVEGRTRLRVLAGEAYHYALPNWLKRGPARTILQDQATLRHFMRYLRPQYAEIALEGNKPPRPDTRWMRVQRLHWGHLTVVLEQLANSAARHQLAYTFPLLDRDALEFAIRMPGEFLVKDGRRRSLLRDATEGILPDLTRQRPEKLTYDPAFAYYLIEARDDFSRLTKRLAETPANEIFELSRFSDGLNNFPDLKEVVAETTKADNEGSQYGNPELSVLLPIMLARFAGRIDLIPPHFGGNN
jgi:asparagine synthase (glutamine-hydrolysing)